MSIATMKLTAADGLPRQPAESSPRRLWRSLSARDAFLLEGRMGRWRWYWALLSTVLAVVGITVAIGMSGLLVALFAGGTSLLDDPLLDPQQPLSFLVILLTFLPMILVPALLVRYLHKLSWRQLISASGRFEWRLYVRAAAAFFVAAAVVSAIDYAVDPNAYRLMRRGIDFLPWLALGLAVIFVQTLAEEILFRGYLLRMWGAVVPFRVLTTSIVMAVFISLHFGNSDFKNDFWFNLIGFALSQILWCYLWFRTESVAASAGLHYANNVLCFFIIATVPGQSTTMAFVSATDSVLLKGGSHLLDPYAWTISLLHLGLIVLLVLWRRSPFYLPARFHRQGRDGPLARVGRARNFGFHHAG